MKRKILCAIGIALITTTLTACGGNNSQVGTKTPTTTAKTVNEVIEEQKNIETTNTPEIVSNNDVEEVNDVQEIEETTSSNEIVEEEIKYDVIDIDLTKASSTIVYSELYNITMEPEKYIGKVIKLSGKAMTIPNPTLGITYHTIYVNDAAACCQNGIEYLLGNDTLTNENMTYPMMDRDITITGRVETYEEDGYTYVHLVNSILK